RFPGITQSERENLAARLKLEKRPLAEVAEQPPYKKIRQVHPSLQRIAAWISTLGAAVALADLDGDGLPNDLCHIDPRTDLVTIAPVPGTGERYAPFSLDPAPIDYDPATMAPMGCLSGDLNEDGYTDLLVYYWGRTPIAFLQR